MKRRVSMVALAFVIVGCGGPAEEADLAETDAPVLATGGECNVTPSPAAPGEAITLSGSGFGSKRYLDFVAYAGAYPAAEIAIYAGVSDNRGNITLHGAAPSAAGTYEVVVWKDFGSRSQVEAGTCYFDVQ